jgi:hypothetical protein
VVVTQFKAKRIAYFCQIMSIVLTLYALLITFAKSTMSCLTFDISFLYLFAEFDIVCRIFLNLIIVRRKKKKREKEAGNSACFECHDKLRNARNFQHVRPLSAPNRREGG